MNRDTQNKPGVSKNAPAAPIGDPQQRQAPATSVASATPRSPQGVVSVTVSSRYVDSRLKQFCLR